MEKLKRSPSKRPYVYLLLIALIFILGFALGIFALDNFRSSQNRAPQQAASMLSQQQSWWMMSICKVRMLWGGKAQVAVV
jgi:hypothetical protein